MGRRIRNDSSRPGAWSRPFVPGKRTRTQAKAQVRVLVTYVTTVTVVTVALAGVKPAAVMYSGNTGPS
jgi:hypothetical protein